MEFIAEYMSSQYNDNKQQKQTEKASTGDVDDDHFYVNRAREIA